MIKYVTFASEQECKDYSEALYKMTLPRHMWNHAGRSTKYMFAWEKHPDRDEWAVLVDDSERMLAPVEPPEPQNLPRPSEEVLERKAAEDAVWAAERAAVEAKVFVVTRNQAAARSVIEAEMAKGELPIARLVELMPEARVTDDTVAKAGGWRGVR
jgi:hypothetical protein